MSVWALGLNHHTAPLDLRGRFAFALDQIAPTLNGLRASLARQPEATLLSTCNRTEIYGAGSSGDIEHALEWLAHNGGVSSSLLRAHAYTLKGDQAARHAFRVASGLDSMVLGEPQILGQMKDAVRAAEDAGVQNFMHWLDQRGTVPLIQQLNAQADAWRTAEIVRAKKLLAKGESIDTVLEALSRGLTQKMLHGALAELHAGDAHSREATAQTVSRMFLRGQPPATPPHSKER